MVEGCLRGARGMGDCIGVVLGWRWQGGQVAKPPLAYGAPAPAPVPRRFWWRYSHSGWGFDLSRFGRSIVVLALAVTVGGCALSFDAGTLGVRVSMSAPAGQPPQGTEFEVSRKAVFLLFGLFRASSPSLEDAMAGQLLDADEVQNLRIRVRSRFADILVSVLTVGLVIPRSVTFHGYTVSADGGAIP